MRKFILVLTVTILTLSCFSQVYKFKSANYDIEKPNVAGYKTHYETTYHTFDFNNNLVTFEGTNSKGTKTVIKYRMKKSYKEPGLLASTWVLVIGEKGVKEIWFSVEANNLGYDLQDGTRVAYYDLTTLMMK